MDSASGGCDEGYSTDIGVEGSACDMEVSPGMTKYWRPNCVESLKPNVGQQQSTTRKGRDGVVVLKQVVCSREGFEQSSSNTFSSTQSTVVKRRRVTNRVGCKAKVLFKVILNGCYCVHFLEERHTHSICLRRLLVSILMFGLQVWTLKTSNVI
nr:protein FAR1-RELATED SEQUENCE 5-like [Ipomoea batatas]